MNELSKHIEKFILESNRDFYNNQIQSAIAKAEKASIIVVGNHGRKGPKRDETIAGSAIQYVSTDITFPVMILKDHKPRT